MEATIIGAEINLNITPPHLTHASDFNETQVRAYLGGLSACYQEVLILTFEKRVAIWAVGQSSALLGRALSAFMEVPTMAKVFTQTRPSKELMYKIMKGECWKDVSSDQREESLRLAILRSHEADCFGEVLHGLVSEAFQVLSVSNRPYTWETRKAALLKYPTVTEFDFQHSSLN